MNKAFVREPEPDGRAYCPQCGTLGFPVGKATLDHHIQTDSRLKLGTANAVCKKYSGSIFEESERLIEPPLVT